MSIKRKQLKDVWFTYDKDIKEAFPIIISVVGDHSTCLNKREAKALGKFITENIK